jgi:SAM-dependent methyltransferase
MNPSVYKTIEQTLNKLKPQGQRVLEVGVGPNVRNRIVNLNIFKDFDKYCLDIVNRPKHADHKMIQANANNMPFKNQSFDVVVSNAMLEHDPCFWLTIQESHRVLKNNGLFMLSAPGFWHGFKGVYPEHGKDYYRFNPMVFSEVFFKKYNKINVIKVLHVVLGYGYKKGA